MNETPNSWICVDANLVVRLVADPADAAVRALWDQWSAERRLIAAPALLLYEVTNALYRYHRQGVMSDASVRLALRAALSLPIRYYGDAALHEEAMELAARLALPAAYDAHYLALAERLDAVFWTADQRLANTVRAALPWVNLVHTGS